MAMYITDIFWATIQGSTDLFEVLSGRFILSEPYVG